MNENFDYQKFKLALLDYVMKILLEKNTSPEALEALPSLIEKLF